MDRHTKTIIVFAFFTISFLILAIVSCLEGIIALATIDGFVSGFYLSLFLNSLDGR